MEIRRDPVFKGLHLCRGLLKGTGNTRGGLNAENFCGQLRRKIVVTAEEQIEKGQGGEYFPFTLGLDGTPVRPVPKLA